MGSVLAGAAAGLGSGLLSATIAPFAARRAEETKQRTAARREIVADARDLAVQANLEDWDVFALGHDPRWLRVRPYLPPSW